MKTMLNIFYRVENAALKEKTKNPTVLKRVIPRAPFSLNEQRKKRTGGKKTTHLRRYWLRYRKPLLFREI